MSDTYTTRETVYAYCIQPAITAALRDADPQLVQASSDGAVDGTTVVATALPGTSDDDYVGNILECIYSSTRANRGKRAMIRAYNGSTKAMTVDAFPAQVLTDDSFRMYTTPDAPIVEDQTEVITTQVRDATRDEDDDFWNDSYVVVEKSALASKSDVALVTDFVQSGGVFTLQSPGLSGNAAVGDLLRLLRFIEVSGEMTRERPSLVREAHIGAYGTQEEERGLRAGSGTIDFFRRGPGISRSGLPGEAHDWLRCTMDYSIASADSVADAGSAGNQIIYTTGNHEVGQFLVTPQGDLCMVVDNDEGGKIYTVSPAPRIPPTIGQTLGRVSTYTPARQLRWAITLYQWIGGVRAIFRAFYGVVPVVTISAEMNAFGRLSFACTAADWYEASRDEAGDVLARAFCARLPTVAPVQTSNMRCNIDGIEFPLTSYNFTPGTVITPVANGTAPNWTDGGAIVNQQGAGQVVAVLNETTRRALDDWISREPLPMLIQDGAQQGYPGILGFWCYQAQYDGATPADNTGFQQLTLPFKVNTNLPAYCGGIPICAIAVA